MKMVKNMGRTADGNEVRQIIIKQMLDKVEHAQS